MPPRPAKRPPTRHIEIKICGLTDVDAVDAAVAAGADWLGAVFFPPSPRAVTAEEAADLFDALPDDIGTVGLFVDPDEALLDHVLNHVRLDLIQLHGRESPERIDAIRLDYGLPVMKALGVSTPADLEAATVYADHADRLLLDAKPPAGSDRPGGHATAFDWSILAGWHSPLPWMLAGGLTPVTVAEAIRATGAPGVDVSSGVERAKGRKDAALIERFCAAVRAAEGE
ncbi:phosphoribosylanthranilate isomerase [Roseospira marina]|uniref:N-(5'-phosphoribosyl)anthranilate isomerase n=1 Tax=Roseospira marina TaxID=140057 RepID=A0A5M6I9J0_9PROT|nr:phosphoribosylanthranilate isomerase [Roseospira marina]KAA5604900.1 phosphoribosylanthranilate isomerase [Roseospira marina]MBB4315239.1 phosphoribosylanthranilate isomerase [Roseospira marina]MBB5088239.1 phosphoribosylanthranilate isomerase [Roseospira marina]